MNPKKTILNYIDAAITGFIVAVVVLIAIAASPVILLITAVGALVGSGEKFLRYCKNVWLGFDNFSSAKTGGHWEDTVSSRLGKAQEAGSKVLGFIANRIDNLWLVTQNEENHCKNAIELRNNKHQVTGR